jgi:replicative DNA helicase
MLYVVLKSLIEKKKVEKFDLQLIINTAQSQGILKNIGGPEYVKTIINMPLEDVNFDIYLQNVLDASTKYKLYVNLRKNTGIIVDNAKEGRSSEDLIGMAESDILDISTMSKAIQEPINFADGLTEYIEERFKNPVEQSGISTGYVILDKQIDGLISGTLAIVAARKKMGKSTLLSNMAVHVAYRLNIPVLYVDTEMTFNEWRTRVVAMMSGIKERTVKHGGYTKEEYNNIINKCLKIVEKGKLFHQHMPGYTVDKLTALCRKYKIKENVGLVVFDYIKEPDSTSVDRRRKEWQILGDVTTRLKDLAGELDIPVLAAVQLNRDEDVAGSDRISWFADIIMHWLKRKGEELEKTGEDGGTYKLVVRDTRRGGATPEEGIGYKFYKTSLKIEEVDAPFQLIKYGNNVINYGTDDEEEF